MSNESTSTAPKPFVFVLMPFKQEFNDIYKYGIKGAAEDAGAYSERVDEQDYTESMLDRIYNQINKADVIVADMTGQNPNVFYEVGYAHALDKIVLLLTQDSKDIPFDLKHRPHIVYGGQIEELRNKLAPKLRWAINESKTRTKSALPNPFGIMVHDRIVPESSTLEDAPTIEVYPPKNNLGELTLKIHVQNVSPEVTEGVSHIYLFASNDSPLTPLYKDFYEIPGRARRSIWMPVSPLKSLPQAESSILPVRYRLDMNLPRIPPDAVEVVTLRLHLKLKAGVEIDGVLSESRTNTLLKEEPLVLRLHTQNSMHQFPFKLEVREAGID
jgi:hypothetical protein